MAPRAYDSTQRLRKQAELKDRIAAAAAKLHAQHGVRGTSYAQIASVAGVSLPTVYAHFPTQDDLLAGCTQHVGARAPAMQGDAVLAAPDLAAAADVLAAAVEQQHRHYEPWLSWREDRVVPLLADLASRRRIALNGLIGQVLKHHMGQGEHREIVAAWECVLSFDFWRRLVREHGLSRPAAHRVIVRLLVAAAA